MDLLRRARELYEKGEMHDALEVAQAACEQRPKDPEGWWLLGCVSRYTGLPGASDAAFHRAGQLNRRRSEPVRLDTEEFCGIVAEVRAAISPDARRRLEHAEVRVEPLPSIDQVKAGLAPDALSRRSRTPADLLVLYQVNHENKAASRGELRGLVQRTLSRA